MRGFPPAFPGERIGLYGGSFNPPHAGHLHVSRLAMRRLGLQRVWWLVTPGNPLKDHRGLAPLHQRLAAARALTHDPGMVPTDIEARLGTHYTVDTLRALKRHYPGVRFVWIMGADSLANFHLWGGWREISRLVPIAIIDRPGFSRAATSSPAGRALARHRLPERDAPRLANIPAPAFCVIHGPRSTLSSTAIRAAAAMDETADAP